MDWLLVEEKESEAAKQAKLKGYVSIGFGRWADKNGTMVAFTTKSGRLAPYEGSDTEPKPVEPACREDDPKPSGFTRPFVDPQLGDDGIHRSDAHVSAPSATLAGLDHAALAKHYDYYAGKFATEALLQLLRRIDQGALNEKELRFYTSKEFGDYALVMKDAVVVLNTTLVTFELTMKHDIRINGGEVSLNLKTLHKESHIPMVILDTMLLDLEQRGPSFWYAEALLLKYAAAVDTYDQRARVLEFDYKSVDSDNDPTEPIGVASAQ